MSVARVGANGTWWWCAGRLLVLGMAEVQGGRYRTTNKGVGKRPCVGVAGPGKETHSLYF